MFKKQTTNLSVPSVKTEFKFKLTFLLVLENYALKL